MIREVETRIMSLTELKSEFRLSEERGNCDIMLLSKVPIKSNEVSSLFLEVSNVHLTSNGRETKKLNGTEGRVDYAPLASLPGNKPDFFIVRGLSFDPRSDYKS